MESDTPDASTKWSQPFLGSVTKFPTRAPKTATASLTQQQGEENVASSALPKHFPPLPPAHTYMRPEAMSKKRQRDPSGGDGADRAKLASSRRSVQKSLSRIEDAAERSAVDGGRAASTRDGQLSGAAPKIPKLAPKSARNDLTVNLNPQVVETLPKESRMLLGLENNA